MATETGPTETNVFKGTNWESATTGRAAWIWGCSSDSKFSSYVIQGWGGDPARLDTVNGTFEFDALPKYCNFKWITDWNQSGTSSDCNMNEDNNYAIANNTTNLPADQRVPYFTGIRARNRDAWPSTNAVGCHYYGQYPAPPYSSWNDTTCDRTSFIVPGEFRIRNTGTWCNRFGKNSLYAQQIHSPCPRIGSQTGELIYITDGRGRGTDGNYYPQGAAYQAPNLPENKTRNGLSGVYSHEYNDATQPVANRGKAICKYTISSVIQNDQDLISAVNAVSSPVAYPNGFPTNWVDMAKKYWCKRFDTTGCSDLSLLDEEHAGLSDILRSVDTESPRKCSRLTAEGPVGDICRAWLEALPNPESVTSQQTDYIEQICNVPENKTRAECACVKRQQYEAYQDGERVFGLNDAVCWWKPCRTDTVSTTILHPRSMGFTSRCTVYNCNSIIDLSHANITGSMLSNIRASTICNVPTPGGPSPGAPAPGEAPVDRDASDSVNPIDDGALQASGNDEEDGGSKNKALAAFGVALLAVFGVGAYLYLDDGTPQAPPATAAQPPAPVENGPKVARGTALKRAKAILKAPKLPKVAEIATAAVPPPAVADTTTRDVSLGVFTLIVAVGAVAIGMEYGNGGDFTTKVDTTIAEDPVLFYGGLAACALGLGGFAAVLYTAF